MGWKGSRGMVRGLGKKLPALSFHSIKVNVRSSIFMCFAYSVSTDHLVSRYRSTATITLQNLWYLVIYISCKCQNKHFYQMNISCTFLMNSFNLGFKSFTFLLHSVFYNIFSVLFSSWLFIPKRVIFIVQRGLYTQD